MLNINDGDGIGQWVRITDQGEPTDPFFAGTAGSLLPALRSARKLTVARERLADGTAVLVHLGGEVRTMTAAVIDDSAVPERGGARYAGTRVVRNPLNSYAALLSEGRMVSVVRYHDRLLGLRKGRSTVANCPGVPPADLLAPQPPPRSTMAMGIFMDR